MTSLADNPEQTIMKVIAPQAAYAVCTFEIDVEKWSLLPVAATSHQARWVDSMYANAICEPAGHCEPADDCRCGAYGYRSLRKLRDVHRQATTLVAVMKYDPSSAVEDENEVRALTATVVAFWISPDLPKRHVAAAVVHDVTGKLCIEYDYLDCMLARYDITERWEAWGGLDEEFDEELRPAAATDGVAPVPRWAHALSWDRPVQTARAVRSWVTVVGRPLIESFSGAVHYATKTARTIVMTIVIAWCAVFTHVYIHTHVTPFAFIDPVLLAGHRLISAILAPPVMLLTMSALGLLALLETVHGAWRLPRRADPIAWAMTVILPFVYLFAEKTVLVFGMLVVLAAANGTPEPSELGWCLVAMFVLNIVARSAPPFCAIYGHLRVLRAQSSWGASTDV